MSVSKVEIEALAGLDLGGGCIWGSEEMFRTLRVMQGALRQTLDDREVGTVEVEAVKAGPVALVLPFEGFEGEDLWAN